MKIERRCSLPQIVLEEANDEEQSEDDDEEPVVNGVFSSTSNLEKQYIETTASDSDENDDIPDISSLDAPESADINDNERNVSENVKETEAISSNKREPLKMKFNLKNNTTSENRLAKEDSNNLIDNS